MQSSVAVGDDVNRVFLCRKCRKLLFDGSCVITAHGDPYFTTAESNTENNSDCVNDSTVWYVNEELAPSWIQDTIHSSQWTKGKLNCPKCQGRVGSFNYLTRFTVPPIHIQCCRVDFMNGRQGHTLAVSRLKTPLHETVSLETTQKSALPEMSSTTKSVVMATKSPNYGANGDICQTEISKLYLENWYHSYCSGLHNHAATPKFTSEQALHQTSVVDHNQYKTSSDRVSENGSQGSVSLDVEDKYMHSQCQTNINHLEGASCDTVATVARQNNLRSSRLHSNQNQGSNNNALEIFTPDVPGVVKRESRHQKHRNDGHGQHQVRTRQRTGSRVPVTTAEDSRVPVPVKVQSSAFDLPAFQEEHVCPICLDLFCQPMRVSPCQHIFCEPCLRKLAMNKPINTQCPMCRQVISACLKDYSLIQTLKASHPEVYKSRILTHRKFLDKKFYHLPGEKNLVQVQHSLHARLRNTTQTNDNGMVVSLMENMSARLKVFVQGLMGLIVLLCCVLIKFNSETVQEGMAMAIPLTCLSVTLGVLLIFILFLSFWYFFIYLFTFFIPMIYNIGAILFPKFAELIRSFILKNDVLQSGPRQWSNDVNMYASNANIVIVFCVLTYGVYKIFNRCIRN